jgi:replicative DNA helicase
VVLSQLNRSVEIRGGLKKPQLSDLRESGAIEQDADMVIFIYRPEYYDMLEGENGENLRGKGEIIIAKHRNGSLNSVYLKFIGQYIKFTDLTSFDLGEDVLGQEEGVSISGPRIVKSRMDEIPDDDNLTGNQNLNDDSPF